MRSPTPWSTLRSTQNGVPLKIMCIGQIKYFINMVNHLDVHTLALFILSLPALRLSQFDAVHELTAILRFR